MATSRPIFEAAGRRYVADTCGPVNQAVQAGTVQLKTLARGHYPGRKLCPGALRGVKTVGFWDAEHDQSWGLDWHRNEGIELTFLERGHLGFAVDSERFTLRPDDLTITRPWQRHRVGLPHVGAGRLHWMILDVGVRRPDQPWRWPAWIVLSKTDRDELTDIFRHNEHPVWKASAELRLCFQRIAQAVETDHEGTNISRLTVLLNEMLLLVLELFRQNRVPLDDTLSGAKRTVELFLADLGHDIMILARPWTVKELARQCGLGVTQFSAYCKTLTNMTPLQYVNHRRLEAAADLLRSQPESDVTHIGLKCGFSSSQYFATSFRRHFGRTPTEFRKRRANQCPSRTRT